MNDGTKVSFCLFVIFKKARDGVFYRLGLIEVGKLE